MREKSRRFPCLVFSMIVSWSEICEISEYLNDFVFANLWISFSDEDVESIQTRKVKLMTGLCSSLDGCLFQDIKDLIKIIAVNNFTSNVITFASYFLGAMLLHNLTVHILIEQIRSFFCVHCLLISILSAKQMTGDRTSFFFNLVETTCELVISSE